LMKRFWLFLSLALFVLPGLVSAAPAARAWLDRDSMQLGETVTLNVEVEDSTATEPDFSPLLADFRSLGTQSSRQISMVNGTTTAKTIWAIGLEPKRAGKLTIPALNVGGVATSPLSLVVTDAPQGSQGKAGDAVFIEVNAEPRDPYVQQQVRYTVKLFYAVDLTEGALDEPALSGLVVQKLGRDKQYSAMLGERRYNVLERNYALIPEQSGSLTIPSLTFRGSALDSSDPTGFFRRGRAISARSTETVLDVRAKPAAWTGSAWLPAASLSLTDENPLPATATVGEPITRALRLRAQGLGYEQLPDIELEAPEGTEVYPDKPDTQTRDDGSWLFGERTRRFAIVPTHPGKLVLPAVEVQWWDTVQDRLATATLPAYEIDVQAATGAQTSTHLDSPSMPATTSRETTVLYPGERDASLQLWRAAALIGFAGWLITFALWWRSRKTLVAVPTKAPPTNRSSGQAEFSRACAMGDLAGAEQGLVRWARSQRAIRNLGELIHQVDEEAQQQALLELQRARYAGGSTDGVATRLSRAFERGIIWRTEAQTPPETSVLPKLYPPQH
jgi:hypothetical protein